MTKYEFWVVTFFVIFIGFALLNIAFGLRQAVAVFIMFIVLCLLIIGVGFFIYILMTQEKSYD